METQLTHIYAIDKDAAGHRLCKKSKKYVASMFSLLFNLFSVTKTSVKFNFKVRRNPMVGSATGC